MSKKEKKALEDAELDALLGNVSTTQDTVKEEKKTSETVVGANHSKNQKKKEKKKKQAEAKAKEESKEAQ